MTQIPLVPADAVGTAEFEPCSVTPVIDMIFSRWTTPILRS